MYQLQAAMHWAQRSGTASTAINMFDRQPAQMRQPHRSPASHHPLACTDSPASMVAWMPLTLRWEPTLGKGEKMVMKSILLGNP